MRHFLLLAVWLACVQATDFTRLSVVNAAERPNVLLICVDDLKPVLGCYGDKLAKSPNIDALAARGVQFDNAYCNQAVCSPSRNALLTGLRSTSLGIYDLGTNFRLAGPDAVTLSQHFKAAGYRAKGLGKIFHLGQGVVPDEMQRQLIHGYYAAMSYMDAQLGRVIGELGRLGLDKNTIIALWGDHGWHLGDHGMWCKHTNYEQATHIPLIIVAPGQAIGQRSPALIESIDIYPTLCELAGLKPVDGLDGASCVNTLADPKHVGKSMVFHAYPRSPAGRGQVIGRTVRTSRYRLVEWKKPGAAAETADLELYDYQTDPDEQQNLAASQPEVAQQLRQMILALPEAKPQLKPNSK